MKILFPLGYYYPSQIGGPANTLYWHNNYLVNNGIETIVIASNVGISDDINIKVNEWIYSKNSKVQYCRGGIFNLRILFLSLKELKNCDIVHLSSICYPFNLFITVVALVLNKRVVISPRGELFDSAYKSRKKWLKRILFGIYGLFQCRIDFHATSSEEINSIRVFFSKANIFYQPNLIDTEYRNVPNVKNENLVFLGRINRIKAIDKLIKALKLSSLFMNSDAKLLIVGKARLGVELQYLEELKNLVDELNLDDKVVFLGQKEGDEKKYILNHSKALVLPSESENFGNVVVEAMAMSLPVIASKGTPWNILSQKNIGWWVSNSPNDLASAIDSLYLLSEQAYFTLCNDCRKFVENELDVNGKNNNWVEFYKK